jgi:galactokinase
MDDLTRKTADAYARAFGEAPEVIAFAPGRVEVLGNHTDYNGGYVLSVAIDLGVSVAAGRNRAHPAEVEARSEAFDETVRFPLDAIRREEGSWSNYVRGVILELTRAGAPLGGVRLAIESSLPIGAGVSSSAALELAVAEACYGLFGGRPRDRMEAARLCQRAEAGFVGVPCGLLDQFSAAFGKKNHALFLDCDTLRHAVEPLGRDDIIVVLADSGEKHALVDGQYAALRRSCERAAARLGELSSDPIRFLRDVRLEDLLAHWEDLEPEDAPRAEHVVRENARVLRGLAAIKARHPDELRRLMLASHASSRDLFGNSTPALDFLVEIASTLPGFLGGKLTGGGFGGSTVNLVEKPRAASFVDALAARFEEKFGRRPRMILAGIGDGARIVHPASDRIIP